MYSLYYVDISNETAVSVKAHDKLPLNKIQLRLLISATSSREAVRQARISYEREEVAQFTRQSLLIALGRE